MATEHPGTTAAKHSHGTAVEYAWRGPISNARLNELHAQGFGHQLLDRDWASQIEQYSLGWVTASCGREVVGFVNVAWDGGEHAFLLDTLVAASHQRRGIGAALVRTATDGAQSRGCKWLHVDFEERLRDFYLRSCRFAPTDAGLVRLR